MTSVKLPIIKSHQREGRRREAGGGRGREVGGENVRRSEQAGGIQYIFNLADVIR